MTSDGLPSRLQLAAEPGHWEITLKTGEMLRLLADGYSIVGDEYVFSLLMEGAPPFEVDVLRIPSNLIEAVYGG